MSTSRKEEVIESTTDFSETAKPVTASPLTTTSLFSSETKGTTEMTGIPERTTTKSIPSTIAETFKNDKTSSQGEKRSTSRPIPAISNQPTIITSSEELTSPHTNLIIIHSEDSTLENAISADFDDIFVPEVVSIGNMDIIDDNEEGSTYGSGSDSGETESFTTVVIEKSSDASTTVFEFTTEKAAVNLKPENNQKSETTTIEGLDSIKTTAYSLKRLTFIY